MGTGGNGDGFRVQDLGFGRRVLKSMFDSLHRSTVSMFPQYLAIKQASIAPKYTRNGYMDSKSGPAVFQIPAGGRGGGLSSLSS